MNRVIVLMSFCLVLVACQPTTDFDERNTLNQVNTNEQTTTNQEENTLNRQTTTNQEVGSNQLDQGNSNESYMINQIYSTAQQGRMMYVGFFPIGTPVSKVLSVWGQPESGDPGYLGYERKYYIGITSKDSKFITAIKSMHPKFQEIRISAVRQVLGNPLSAGHHPDGQMYLLYQAGNYQLTFNYQGTRVVSVYLEKAQ